MFQFFCIILSLHTQFTQLWSFSWLPLTFQKSVDSHWFTRIYLNLAEFIASKYQHENFIEFITNVPIFLRYSFFPYSIYPTLKFFLTSANFSKNCWFALVCLNLSGFIWIYPIIFQMSTAPWRCEQISIFSTFPTQHNLPKPTGPSFPPLPNICDWFNLIKFIRI